MDDIVLGNIYAEIEREGKTEKQPSFTLDLDPVPAGTKLINRGDIPFDTIIDYFHKCYEFYENAEVLALLKQEAKRRGADEAVAKLQRKAMNLVGIDPKYGESFMTSLAQRFSDDILYMLPFQNFINREEVLLDEIEGASGPDIAMKKSMFRQAQQNERPLLDKMKALPKAERGPFVQQQMAEAEKMKAAMRKQAEENILNQLLSLKPQERLDFVQEQVAAVPPQLRQQAMADFQRLLYAANTQDNS